MFEHEIFFLVMTCHQSFILYGHSIITIIIDENKKKMNEIRYPNEI